MRSSQWRRRLFVAISTILIFSEITMTMCLKDENVRNEIVGESSSTPAADAEEESLPASSMVKPTAPFSVRLHLVRHGETESNKSHLVMGQSDSVSTLSKGQQETQTSTSLTMYPTVFISNTHIELTLYNFCAYI